MPTSAAVTVLCSAAALPRSAGRADVTSVAHDPRRQIFRGNSPRARTTTTARRARTSGAAAAVWSGRATYGLILVSCDRTRIWGDALRRTAVRRRTVSQRTGRGGRVQVRRCGLSHQPHQEQSQVHRRTRGARRHPLAQDLCACGCGGNTAMSAAANANLRQCIR